MLRMSILRASNISFLLCNKVTVYFQKYRKFVTILQSSNAHELLVAHHILAGYAFTGRAWCAHLGGQPALAGVEHLPARRARHLSLLSSHRLFLLRHSRFTGGLLLLHGDLLSFHLYLHLFALDHDLNPVI